jgi:hypothetical protein
MRRAVMNRDVHVSFGEGGILRFTLPKNQESFDRYQLVDISCHLLFPSNESNNAGNNIKLKINAMSRVMEMSIPNAAVPPNEEAAKMPNPKNKINAM